MGNVLYYEKYVRYFLENAFTKSGWYKKVLLVEISLCGEADVKCTSFKFYILMLIIGGSEKVPPIFKSIKNLRRYLI